MHENGETKYQSTSGVSDEHNGRKEVELLDFLSRKGEANCDREEGNMCVADEKYERQKAIEAIGAGVIESAVNCKRGTEGDRDSNREENESSPKKNRTCHSQLTGKGELTSLEGN